LLQEGVFTKSPHGLEIGSYDTAKGWNGEEKKDEHVEKHFKNYSSF
jgi:hypothetical protein